jgi:hypothetical protein
MANYLIYKYIYKGEIVYIGKTSYLDKRIYQHTLETRFFGLTEIYYYICANKKEMDFLEAYLINKYRPVLNKLSPQFEKIEIDDSLLHWNKYLKKIEFEIPIIEEEDFPIYNAKITKEVWVNGRGFNVYKIAGKDFFDADKVSDYLSEVWHTIRDELTEEYNKYFNEKLRSLQN